MTSLARLRPFGRVPLPNPIRNTIKNVTRLRQILTVFMRHGFSDFIAHLGLDHVIPFHKSQPPAEPAQQARNIRVALEELGPTFIKLGQTLAGRPDLVPLDYRQEFRKLHSQVTAFSADEVVAQIEAELSCKVETIFTTFDRTPLAAASIAQVHQATLADGTDVVVKIQRPGIEPVIETDLGILYWLATLVDRTLPDFRVYNPVGIVDEFFTSMKLELDFLAEARNTDQMQHFFEDDDSIVIPDIYWDLSTKRILTMKRITGIKLEDKQRLLDAGIDLEWITHQTVQAFFSQLFKLGTFHADLHAGNILALSHNRIALIDFGNVGRLPKRLTEDLGEIFLALVAQDFERVASVYASLGETDPAFDLTAFQRDVERILTPTYGLNIADVKIAELFIALSAVSQKHKVRFPRDLVLLFRSIIALESLCRELNPELNLTQEASQFAQDLVRTRFSPTNLVRDLSGVTRDVNRLLKLLPGRANDLFQQLSRREFSIETRNPLLIRGLLRATHRLMIGLILASMLLSSALITAHHVGPSLFGISFLGLMGFGSCGFLGVFLLYLITRRES